MGAKRETTGPGAVKLMMTGMTAASTSAIAFTESPASLVTVSV